MKRVLVTYFDEMGKVNTEETLSLALARAQELNLKRVVVASTTGYTARRALEVLGPAGMKITVVGVTRETFDPQVLAEVEQAGHRVLFWGEEAVAWSEWVNNTFRKICEGMKVAAQSVALATDRGSVVEGEAVLAVAGTGPIDFAEGGGADTALVMTAGPSSEYA